jgi:uncharacterized membrane-anchored protein YitT (DUF2179 family)
MRIADKYKISKTVILTHKTTDNRFLEFLQIAFGITLTSIGLKAFLLPNGFLDGGITGVSILLNKTLGLNMSVVLVILSMPFLAMCYKLVSKAVTIKSVFSIIILAILIHIEDFPAITEDKLLIAIFGGLFVGSGIGISIRNGAVLDASEILGIVANQKFGISIGKFVMFFNTILFIITSIFVSVEVAMYSILTFIVTAKVIDYFIKGFEDFIGLMIVSKNNSEICEVLKEKMGNGMTVYKGVSGSGSSGEVEDITIIHSVINRIDIARFYRLVNHIDKKAFIVEYDVNNIQGGALRKYLKW